MTESSNDIALIGAANVDLVMRLEGEMAAGLSNPAAMTLRIGGAARNIAACLARLGQRPLLLSAFADDSDGAAIAGDAEMTGVDLINLSGGQGRTSRYIAALDPEGRLSVAFNDMGIHEQTSALDGKAMAQAMLCRWWLADANLSSDLLESLILTEDRPPVAVAAVSVAKVVRLAGLLDRIDLLLLNQREAEALLRLEESGEGLDAAARLAGDLLAKGPSIVAVTAGAAGSVLALEGIIYRAAARPECAIADCVGAGDGFAAGVLASLLREEAAEVWLTRGNAAASLVIESDQAAPETLNWSAVDGRAGDITVTRDDAAGCQSG
ncbi:MAG: PfkB family carbohydrate kinase [Rhodospirillales bacterium]